MKVNEAPEKIYIQPDAQDGWFMVNNLNNTLVEYTSTDAFVDKACSWLENNLQGIVGGSIYIEDFREYLKK